jgi:hypothetical protein
MFHFHSYFKNMDEFTYWGVYICVKIHETIPPEDRRPTLYIHRCENLESKINK